MNWLLALIHCWLFLLRFILLPSIPLFVVNLSWNVVWLKLLDLVCCHGSRGSLALAVSCCRLASVCCSTDFVVLVVGLPCLASTVRLAVIAAVGLAFCDSSVRIFWASLVSVIISIHSPISRPLLLPVVIRICYGSCVGCNWLSSLLLQCQCHQPWWHCCWISCSIVAVVVGSAAA